jgi:micrococcal nuclease
MYGTGPAGGGEYRQVVRVVDGDTVVLSDNITVRILGIDSPETKDPRKPVQCGGPEASAWARSVLPEGSRVVLAPDATQDAKDRYDRTLGYIEYQVGNEWKDFSTESARAGMSRAYVYDKKVTLYSAIESAQAEAQAARRGLWSHC